MAETPARAIGARVSEVVCAWATTEDVANALKAKDIRGIRNTARFLNPVVRLLRQEIPEAREVDLTMGDTLRIVIPDGWEAHVPLPAPVKDFLSAFHRGDYPDLEMPSPPE